jgi:hypothetical protein
VSTPLADNPGHAEALCARLDLGGVAGAPGRVHGGFHHRMWRLATGRGCFAIKQLAPDIDLNDAGMRDKYNLAETVAETFAARGVGAIAALRNEDAYLQVIDGTGYLVYPWSDGSALEKNAVSERHALQVARVLAQLHRADIAVPGLPAPEPEGLSQQQVRELVRRAAERNAGFAGALADRLPVILEILAAYNASYPVLQERLVISHGDLDQKNVLWDASGNPLLIDWESAHRLNPTYEVLLEALDWSGVTSAFDRALFAKVIAAYRRAGGVIEGEHVAAGFHCILGDWLEWLMYNVGRVVYLEEADQRSLGAAQVDYVLPTILRMHRLLPDLLSLAEKCLSRAGDRPQG